METVTKTHAMNESADEELGLRVTAANLRHSRATLRGSQRVGISVLVAHDSEWSLAGQLGPLARRQERRDEEARSRGYARRPRMGGNELRSGGAPSYVELHRASAQG